MKTPIPKHHWRYADVKILVEDMLKEKGELTYQQIVWGFQPGTVCERTLDLVMEELVRDQFVDAISDPMHHGKYDDIMVWEG